MKGTGVRVVNVLPGFVDTEGLEDFLKGADEKALAKYGVDVDFVRYNIAVLIFANFRLYDNCSCQE